MLAATIKRSNISAVKPIFRMCSSYKSVDDDDISTLKTLVSSVLTDSEDVAPYNTDWMNKYHGFGKVVLRPKNTTEVSNALRYCNDNNIAVVPQGGNTGLVGGSIPISDEVVISLSNMNTVHSFDPLSGIMVTDAGCVLEKLDNWLAERNHMMPIDLGAKGTCQIGGNVATNAGGLRLVRYGSLHGTVLGMEVVKADGTVVDMLTSLRKDNTGYDLKQLFIGSEGTLGIITKLSILCPRRPTSVNIAFLGCDSYENVQETLIKAKHSLGEILSAVEFLDRGSMNLVLNHVTGSRDPLSDEFPFYVLVETAGSNADHDMEKLSSFLEEAMGDGTVLDGVLAQDDTQAKALWQMREEITTALGMAGAVYKYDLSMPVSEMYNLVEDTRERLAPLGATVVGYGHLGDSNLHLNISVKEKDSKIQNAIEPYVYEWTAEKRGSISAEHGLGQMKPRHMHFSKSPEAIALMHQMKKVLDPKGILNPYKVLPPDSA